MEKTISKKIIQILLDESKQNYENYKTEVNKPATTYWQGRTDSLTLLLEEYFK